MKMFVHCTEAYMPMYEQYFRPSLPPSFEVTFEKDPDLYKDLTYRSERQLNQAYWDYMWSRIITLIESHIGEVIVYTGVDIQFFKDVVPELSSMIEGKSVLFMNDVGCRCPEFMTIRCSKQVADTFRKLVDLYHRPKAPNDSLILTGMTLPFKFEMLPKSYWTIGWCTMKNLPVKVPDDIRLHHANYVVGFNDKMNILARIREEARKKGIFWATETAPKPS